jgi:hypothetical protein
MAHQVRRAPATHSLQLDSKIVRQVEKTKGSPRRRFGPSEQNCLHGERRSGTPAARQSKWNWYHAVRRSSAALPQTVPSTSRPNHHLDLLGKVPGPTDDITPDSGAAAQMILGRKPRTTAQERKRDSRATCSENRRAHTTAEDVHWAKAQKSSHRRCRPWLLALRDGPAGSLQPKLENSERRSSSFQGLARG